MDALHSYDGIFQYMENGFYVKQKDVTEFIKWDEIVSVYSFSIPVLQERQTGMEIITDNKEYEFDDRNTLGIEKLTDELSSRMPDWKLDSPTIVISNFGLKKTLFYQRNT